MLKKLFFITFSMMVNAQLWAIDAPTLSSPSPDYQNAYTRIVLKGENGKNDGYHLQVDTTTQFNSPLLHEETWSKSTTSFSSTVTDLHFNCHYYWRVRSVSPTEEGVFSDWSEVRDFYTNHPVETESPNDPEHTLNYYPQVDLEWKNHLGSGTYVFEIDTVPSFTSPGKIREQWSGSAPTKEGTTSHTVSNLYLGKKIYWHVRLLNKNDSSQWSETACFYTISKAVGKFPNGLTSAYTTQDFEWKYQRGLTNVIIELDTTPAFNSPAKRTELSWGSNQDNCYTTISQLLFGATYYWRVKSYHQKDTTQWSDVLTFTTYDFCALSSPSDSAVNRYTSGKISWRYSKGISTYQVQLDTVPTFNSPVLISKLESAGNDDNAYYSYSQLYFGKWYYWRVRECHKNDTSKWSKTRCFKTYRHCNLNTTPTDSATNVSTSPELYFTYATGVSNYQQQIDTTPSFDSPLCETKMSTGASSSNYNYHSFIDLLFGTRYYRRVRECLPHDTTDWSPIRSFTTIEKGAYSTSYSITKGETNVSVTPDLYYAYRNYIDSVEVQLDTAISFDSPLFESYRVKEASSQKYAYVTPNKNLLYGTTYYWRIRDIHAKDISGWTTPRYFTTKYISPAPTLVAPADLSIVYAENTTSEFSWKAYVPANGEVEEYTMQVSETDTFDDIILESTVTDTATTAILPINTVLYWRVRANTTLGQTEWSDAWLLTTKDSSDLFSLDVPAFTKPENSPLTDAYTRQYFNWTTVTDATKYILQVDTTRTFDSPELIQREYTTNGSNNVIYNFRFDTHYYYRIRAIAQNGIEKSRWSELHEFTTLSKVTLDSPNDSEAEFAYYPSQNLSWKNSFGSTLYKIEIDTSANFDSPAILRYTHSSYHGNTDTYVNQSVSNLMLGKMTYWRVRAYNEKDSSDWSISMCFKTYNNATGTSPSDSLVNAYTQQTLYWECISGLPHVILELDTTATFNSDIKRTIDTWAYYNNDAHQEVSNLLFGTQYFWRVRYYHDRDTTKWSSVRTFTTYDFCTLSTPDDGATNQLTTGNLYWRWSKGVSYYQVQIDTVPTFDSPELTSTIDWDPENGGHVYQYKNLLFGTTYYWHVRECHQNDTSKWSMTRNFTTYSRGLQGSSPADGATNISVTPRLYIDYTNNISIYLVQIDTVETFDSNLLQTKTISATSDTYAYWKVEKDLLYGTTYYWRTADAHARDTSDWAYPHSFTTTYQMSKPNLVGPVNQSTIYNGDLAVFNWDKCEDATQYIFQLSDDGQFNTCLHQKLVTDTVTSMVLPDNSILYWRVQAVNSQGRSPWSDVRGISTNSSMPTEISETSENRKQTKKQIRNGRMYIVQQNRKYNILGIKIHN